MPEDQHEALWLLAEGLDPTTSTARGPSCGWGRPHAQAGP